MNLLSPCNDHDLVKMLESNEPASAFETLLKHIESCDSCQRRLDQLAAGESQWKLATDVLSGFSSNQVLRSTMNFGSNQLPRESPHVVWTESMARQLLTPASHPEMLGRIGRYEVEKLVGSGGMGIVFKAFDTELNRPVAIKILAPYLAGSGVARQRFAREAKAAAAVVHEHVVPIHNVETDGQSPFLVMRYVAGESLQSRIDSQGSLDICQVLRIGQQVASGLSAAHAHGLVHRDIKPSNILVESGVERTLITDFGLAQAADDASLTNTGYHPGTPQFMSPEQARGDSVDARSDLFSLGSVLYTMCTGRPPFRAETSFGILRRITDTEPRQIQELNPQIPAWLVGIINKLMSKSLSERYQTADEVSKLLEKCLAHWQQPATFPLPSEAKLFEAKASRWKPNMLIPSVGCIILVVLGLSSIKNSANNSTQQPGVSLLDNTSDSDKVTTKESRSRQAVPEQNDKQRTRQQGPRKQPPATAEDVIRQNLTQEAEVKFVGLNLQQAVAEILRDSKVKCSLVTEPFLAASIDIAQTSSMSAKGSASDLLNRICERYEASYVVNSSGIEVVPLQSTYHTPTTRYYDLAFVKPDSKLTAKIASAIQQLIEPENWSSSGGSFSLSLVDSVLVIKANELSHQQIERLLSQLVSL